MENNTTIYSATVDVMGRKVMTGPHSFKRKVKLSQFIGIFVDPERAMSYCEEYTDDGIVLTIDRDKEGNTVWNELTYDDDTEKPHAFVAFGHIVIGGKRHKALIQITPEPIIK